MFQLRLCQSDSPTLHLYGLGSEDWGHLALTPNTETLLPKGGKTHTSAIHKFAVSNFCFVLVQDQVISWSQDGLID